MDFETFLGLYFVLLRTTSQTYILQMIFGLMSEIFSDYLKFSRSLIIHWLKNDLYSKIIIPDDNEISQYKNMISYRHPLLEYVWCTIDGIKLNIERYTEYLKQRIY